MDTVNNGIDVSHKGKTAPVSDIPEPIGLHQRILGRCQYKIIDQLVFVGRKSAQIHAMPNEYSITGIIIAPMQYILGTFTR